MSTDLDDLVVVHNQNLPRSSRNVRKHRWLLATSNEYESMDKEMDLIVPEHASLICFA